MEDIGKYGKIIREYQGDGFITLSDGTIQDCHIQAVQLSNGNIVAFCDSDKYPITMFDYVIKHKVIKNIQGITQNNENFVLEGKIFISFFNMSRLVVFANSMTSEKSVMNYLESIKFGITNFEFVGNKWKEFDNSGKSLDILEVKNIQVTIEIHRIQNYKEIMESIKARKGIDVSCEAIIRTDSIHEIDSYINAIDTLCRLLSIARGTKVNWIYYDGYDGNLDKVLSYHRNSITRQYTSSSLIDPDNPQETASFLEQVYGSYQTNKELFSLDKAIEAYLDAKAEGVYLETRALQAVIVLEFLKSKYATKKDIELILKTCQFKKIRQSIGQTLNELSKEMSLSENTLKEIVFKIGELNRRRFRAILVTMFEELEINLTQDELSRLINIRNSLVHNASFFTKEYWKEYTFLISIIDRTFLKILNYQGPYLDISNEFNRVNEQLL